MISSREPDYKVLRMAIQFEYFFSNKKQNGECNVSNVKWFLFGMSPDVRAFKVHVFTSDLRISANILTQILLTLDFHCFTNFAKKKYQFVV